MARDGAAYGDTSRAVVAAEVALPAQDGGRPAPHRRVGERPHARRLEPVVELGDAEELEAQRRAAAVAGQQREAGGESAAGALAVDADPLGVDAQLAGRGVQPPQRGVAVLDPGRERVLGGEPVLDRHHHDAEVAGEGDRAGVLHRHRPDDEAAAVDVEQGRAGRRTLVGRVDADEHLGRALGPGDVPVLVAHTGLVDVAGEHADDVVEALAGRRDVGEVVLREDVDDRLELGIERVGAGHGPGPYAANSQYWSSIIIGRR